MYGAKMDAQSDYNTEVANELYADGYFNDDVVDDIMNGSFDDELYIYIGNMIDAKLKSWHKVAYTKGTKPEVYTYLMGKIEAIEELLSLLQKS